ncbi:MAG: hypothetical protein AAF548_00475 [Actinomycetota bacterium]
MSRMTPPEGSMNFFEHDGDLNDRFDRFYAELWQRGGVDEATKEVGRLRNARITDCGI